MSVGLFRFSPAKSCGLWRGEEGQGSGGGPQLGGKWSAPELPMSPAMAFSAFAGGKAPDAEVKAWTDAGWTDVEGPSVRGPESVDIPGESGIIDVDAEPISPSREKNPTALPEGRPTKISPKCDAEGVRSYNRENEAAATIARSGYVIEQQPKVEGSKRPDYRIEGEIFDCYSPTAGKDARGMASVIRDKISEKQTQRIVLNLDDWLGDVKDIVKQLNDYPISGLKEVLVVRNGEVTHIYP